MTTFNFTFEPGVTIQQALGFEMAGRIWSRYLSDPVTLNIHVGMSGRLPANVIGGALPGILPNADFYDVLHQGLSSDQKSADDTTAFKNAFFFSRATVGYVVPLVTPDGRSVQQGFWSSSETVNLTRANAKAIGGISATNTALDGAIVMGTLAGSSHHWNYDYTRSTTPPTGAIDYLSVALHELGHVMGFVSGVDLSGWNFTQVTNTYTIPDDLKQRLNDRTQYMTPLDRLRFSTNTSAALDTNDLSYGSQSGDKFFALGRGGIRLADFSTGKDRNVQGDGYQASHWEEQATPLGIMDPAISPRERVSISNLDLRAFDVIGWDLRSGLSAGALTSSILTPIRDAAVQAIAGRLRQTTTWVNSNLSSSPSGLVRARTADVDAMISASLVYEGRRGSGSTATSSSSWMEVYNQMASNQEVYVNFSTVSTLNRDAVAPLLETTAGGATLAGTGGSNGRGRGRDHNGSWSVGGDVLLRPSTASVARGTVDPLLGEVRSLGTQSTETGMRSNRGRGVRLGNEDGFARRGGSGNGSRHRSRRVELTPWVRSEASVMGRGVRQNDLERLESREPIAELKQPMQRIGTTARQRLLLDERLGESSLAPSVVNGGTNPDNLFFFRSSNPV